MARRTRSTTGCRCRSTSTATTSSTWATTALSRMAAPTTSASSATAASTCIAGAVGAADVRRTGLFLQNLVYNRAVERFAEVRRDAGRRARLQQHVCRRDRRARTGEQRPLPQQPGHLSGATRSGIRRRQLQRTTRRRITTRFRPWPEETARSNGTRPRQASWPITRRRRSCTATRR